VRKVGSNKKPGRILSTKGKESVQVKSKKGQGLGCRILTYQAPSLSP